jgi:hypothetical protein
LAADQSVWATGCRRSVGGRLFASNRTALAR